MKPDITAPGVEIVAARAAGTSLGEPVDQWYTRLTGTSMAHVAGAAAVMAQRWPDWTPARIKAVLMGTASPIPTSGCTSRARVAWTWPAIAQRVIARRANVDFGFFRYPQTGAQPVTKAVPLLNLGDTETAVELRLELEDEDGNPAPAAMASLARPRRPCPPAARPAPSSPSTSVGLPRPLQRRRGRDPGQRTARARPGRLLQGAGALRPHPQGPRPRRPAGAWPTPA